MILIITHKADFTVDFIINKLNKEMIPYKRFNCEDILTNDISIHNNNHFIYSILGNENYKSIWFRRTKFPDLADIEPHYKSYLLGEIDSLINNLFSVLDARWLSEPSNVYRAENKLLQLKVANNLGFSVPKTLVTNSKHELRVFYETHDRNIIIKPISQTRITRDNKSSLIFTNKIDDDIISRLHDYDMTPCIFQNNVEKDYEVRVTVVGKQVFAAAVRSQRESETLIDWRRKKLHFEKTDLPNEIEKLCIKLVEELGLYFGAIDLIKTCDGEYVFLEINPNGQWVWIENETGLQISNAIINFLK